MIAFSGIKISDLRSLKEAGLISTSEMNLRSKIDSILRSLENLTQKKMRIEFEIKKQRKSLERKRLELKRSHKSQTFKAKIALESSKSNLDPTLIKIIQEQLRLDSIALQMSDLVLNQD